MAFSISEFQSKINQHGLAASNLFVLRITKIPETLRSQIPTSELVFFCKSVDLPSLTLQTEDYYAQGFGAKERRPNAIDMPILPATFYIDSNHKVLKFFHAWLQSIINYDMEAGVFAEVDGRLPFELEYKDQYVGEIEVIYYSPNYPDKFYTYKFHNVHPIEVGTLSLSWDANDEISILPVSFSYDALKVDGSRSGVVSDNPNRGTSIYEYVYGLQSAVSQIRGISRPNSIQDIINSYTTINNIYSALT